MIMVEKKYMEAVNGKIWYYLKKLVQFKKNFFKDTYISQEHPVNEA